MAPETDLSRASQTIGVSIERPWQEVYAAIWRPECFPKWAAGLSAADLHHDGTGWRAQGPQGPIRLRFTGHNSFGIMDHHVDLGDGPEIYVPLRIVADGDGTVAVLTLLRQPGMSDEAFAADAEAIARDLATLKAMVEGGAFAASDRASTRDLLAAAAAAREKAYAPYSKFAVGAAVLTDRGEIFAGANVENASYPVGTCAEAGAIAAMVAAGGRVIVEALVLGESARPITPCGACRQRLAEFGRAEVPIHAAGPAGIQATHTLGTLLPQAFTLGDA